MLLDQKIVEKFIGGQAKILNERKCCLYQGEISGVTATECGLTLTFSWLAENKDFFSKEKLWVFTDKKNYFTQLSFFEDQDMKKLAEFKKMPNDQLILFSGIAEEVIVLLPPNYGNALKKEDVVEKKHRANN